MAKKDKPPDPDKYRYMGMGTWLKRKKRGPSGCFGVLLILSLVPAAVSGLAVSLINMEDGHERGQAAGYGNLLGHDGPGEGMASTGAAVEGQEAAAEGGTEG